MVGNSASDLHPERPFKRKAGTMNKLKMTWERVGEELVCHWVKSEEQDARGAEESVNVDARLSERKLVVARAA